MPKYAHYITAESRGEMAVCLSLNGVSCMVKGNIHCYRKYETNNVVFFILKVMEIYSIW